MPGMDPVSLAGAKDKIVLLDQGVGFFSYHDLMKACRVEVTIYMKENNLKGRYILTGMAKV